MSKLPLIGDVVYRISMNVSKDGTEVPVGITLERFTPSLLGKFGKTVFSTRKEAEAAMRKRPQGMPQRPAAIGVRTDCFAYSDLNPSGEPQCTALMELYCKTERCKFYKRKGTVEV